MKKSRILSTILAATILSTGLSNAALVGYWPFDENAGTTAANAQGNAALDAQFRANSAWGAGANGSTSSLELDGTTASAADVSGLTTSFTNMTISSWINPDVAPQAWTAIFGSRAGGVNQVGFGFRNATGNLVYTWNGNSSTTWDWDSGLNVPLQEWSYAALVLTPTEATIYLGTGGGGLVSATNAIPHLTESGGDWTVGIDDCCGNTRNFDGRIDDLAIWDQALGQSAIQSLFDGSANPLTVPEPSGVGLLGLAAITLMLRRRRH